VTKRTKAPKATVVKIKDRDWQRVSLAAEGDEYAQARLADLLGWDGDNDQFAVVREVGADYALVEIEIDGSVYARYKLR
jgi:hypothetical protein